MDRDVTILEVSGMSCGSCIRHVAHALKQLDGVADVEVRLESGEVEVRHDASLAPPRELVAALDGAGYPARPRA